MNGLYPYLFCALVAVMLALGQFLFKLAAVEWKVQLDAGGGIFSILSVPFFAAISLYAVATILWIYALRFVPLSRGYLFVLAGAVLVPVIAHYVFKEPIGATYWTGFAMILIGLYLCSL